MSKMKYDVDCRLEGGDSPTSSLKKNAKKTNIPEAQGTGRRWGQTHTSKDSKPCNPAPVKRS